VLAVEHHLDRVVVEPDSVLDRAHAGAQRVLDAGVRLRVRHHLKPWAAASSTAARICRR